jgi:hypothetical protein
MELDVIKTSPTRKGARQQKGKGKALTCYACGKLGHMARNCRTKNMVSRPQLNMMQTKKYEDDSCRMDPVWDDRKLDRLLAAQSLAEQAVTDRIRELEYQDHGEGEQWPNGEGWDEPTEEWDLLETPNATDDNTEVFSDEEDAVVASSPSPLPWMESDNAEVDKPRHERGYYYVDSHHLMHPLMYYMVCASFTCPAHFSRRFEWHEQPKCGKTNFLDCEDAQCPHHLIGKREQGYFPGKGYPDEGSQYTYDSDDPHKAKDECTFKDWKYCSNNKCPRHRKIKDWFRIPDTSLPLFEQRKEEVLTARANARN